MDRVRIEVLNHISKYFFFTSVLVERHDDDRRLVSESTSTSLYTAYLRRGIISKDGIFAINKIGILIENVDRSDVINFLIIESIVDLLRMRILGMYAILAKTFSLLNGFAESKSTLISKT